MRHVALALLLLSSCGEAAPPPARAPKTAEAVAKKVEPAPKSRIQGIGEDSGLCMRTKSWEAAERWMKAFRLRKSNAPSKGAEAPKISLERLDVSSDSGLPELRAYRQDAHYPLADTTVRRRFFIHAADGAITGCLLGDGEEKPPKLYFTRLADGVFELTDRAKPKNARSDQMVNALVGIQPQIRHICSLQANMLGCVTLDATSSTEVRVTRSAVVYRSATSVLRLGLASSYTGSLRMQLRRGASTSILTLAPLEAVSFSSRPTNEIQERPEPDPPPQPLVFASEVGAFADHGACISGAKPETAELWAMLFGERPGAVSARRVHPPLAADDEENLEEEAPQPRAPLVTLMTSPLGNEASFVVHHLGEHVAACFLGGGVDLSPIAGSYESAGADAFRFRAKRSSGVLTDAGLGSGVIVREVVVACRVEGQELGCAVAPVRWTATDFFISKNRPRSTTSKHTARVRVLNGTLTWSGERDFDLPLKPGSVTRLTLSSGGHPSKKQLKGKSQLSTRIHRDGS